MSALTNRTDILTKKARGFGLYLPFEDATGGSPTAGTANSGFFTITLYFNLVGTTVPTTLVGNQIAPGPTASIFSTGQLASCQSAGNEGFFAIAYKIGTVDLANAAATPYDGFTHDAGFTGPLKRTVYGAASKAITLIPMVYLTTATATTAPAFIMKTTAGGAGYVNQAGSNVIGTKTFTFPAATTVIDSCFVMRPENGDTGVQDITQLSVTVKGTTGAATIFGVEFIGPQSALNIGTGSYHDMVFGGLNMTDIVPAVPTTGTVTSYLISFNMNGGGTRQALGLLTGVLNT